MGSFGEYLTTRTEFVQNRRTSAVLCRVSERESSGVILLVATSVVSGTTGAAQQLADVDAAASVVGAVCCCSRGRAPALGIAGRLRALLGALSGPRWRWTAAAGLATAGYQAAYFGRRPGGRRARDRRRPRQRAGVLCPARTALARRAAPTTWIAATACAVTGCALLLVPGSESAASLTAVALALVAGSVYGVYTTCVKHLLASEADAIAVLGATLAAGAAASAPASSPAPTHSPRPPASVLAGGFGRRDRGRVRALRVGLSRVPAATAGTLSLT